MAPRQKESFKLMEIKLTRKKTLEPSKWLTILFKILVAAIQ
jgi:hypothetical protein